MSDNETASGGEYSCEVAITKMGFGPFQWRLAFISGTSWCTEAMEVMLLSLLLPFLQEEWELTSFEVSTVASGVFMGAAAGSYVWGYVSDKYGRRTAFITGALFLAVFGFLSATSPSLLYLVFSRFMVGIGMGSGHVSYNLFAEYLPQSIRAGPLIAFNLFWSLGGIVEVALCWVVLTNIHWRWLLVLTAVPVAALLLLYPVIPESPRYYLVTGEQEKAVAQLELVSRLNSKPLPTGTLRKCSQDTRSQRGNFWDLFNKQFRTTTLLLWLIWSINNLAYYGLILVTPTFFATLAQNDSPDSSGSGQGKPEPEYFSTFIASCAEFPGIITTALVIERVGRKKLNTILLIITAVCTTLLSMYEYYPYAVGLFLVVVGRAAVTSAFGVIWVYTPEVYPTTIRSTGMGAVATVAKVSALLTPFVSYLLIEYFGTGAPVALFGISCFFAAAATMMLPYNTDGREMPETAEDASRPNDHEIPEIEMGELGSGKFD
eukprot:TRINITY_DN1659_c0_g1_i4.p1 TRINITY_DN1659_c0_g1~~TRINITY_DN1659_c0_g1_i4.p1  ORF type:complete len:489 (-),score=26.74 TRINITY_DN1659_c0_g1_i4:312-1778(-)